MFKGMNVEMTRSLFADDHERVMSEAAMFVEQLAGNRFGSSPLIIRTDMQNPHSGRIHAHTTKPEMISHFCPVQAKTLVGNVSPERCRIPRSHHGSGLSDICRPTFHSIPRSRASGPLQGRPLY